MHSSSLPGDAEPDQKKARQTKGKLKRESPLARVHQLLQSSDEQILTEINGEKFCSRLNCLELIYIIEHQSTAIELKHAAYLALFREGELSDLQALAFGIDFTKLIAWHDQQPYDALYVAIYHMRADVMCWLHQTVEIFKDLTPEQRIDIMLFTVELESMNCLLLLNKPFNKGGFGWDLNVISSDGHSLLSIAHLTGNNQLFIKLLMPLENGGFGLSLDQDVLNFLLRDNPVVIQSDSRVQYQRKIKRRPSFILEAGNSALDAECYIPVKPLGSGTFGYARLFSSTSNPGKHLCVKNPTPICQPITSGADLYVSAKNLNRELLMMKTAYPDDRYHIQHFFDETTQKFDYRFIMPFIEGESYHAIVLAMTGIEELPYWILAIAQELQRIHDLGIIHLDVKPKNIIGRKMLDNATQRFSYKVTFVDFGFANYINHSTPTFTEETSNMAPELFVKSENPTLAQTAIDVYAMANLTKLTVSFCKKFLTAAHKDWKERYICIPTFINNGMKNNPAERPTLKTFIEDLSKVLKGEEPNSQSVIRPK